MIEQIKKDREDGTPGKWVFDPSVGDVVSNSCGCAITYSCNPNDQARIARVPELEEAYIAAIEALKSAHGFVLISDHATSSRVLAEVEAVLANAKGAA